MKIVIIGLGTMGESVLASLGGEGHTVTLIDESEQVISRLIEKYDVAGVVATVLAWTSKGKLAQKVPTSWSP